MKPADLVFVIGSLWFGVALACDDHIGKCEIEEWTWGYTAIMEALTIEGSATCDTGQVSMRLYDGEGEGAKFLGVETGYITGHGFKVLKMGISKPASLSFKYSIR